MRNHLQNLIWISTALLLLSCFQKPMVDREILVNDESLGHCFFTTNSKKDTLKFNRSMTIVKNTLNDTIILGHGVLPPKYVGPFAYSKLGEKNDVLLDVNYNNTPTKTICISKYNDKKSEGVLSLELRIND